MSSTNKDVVRKIDAAFAESNLEGFLAQCGDEIQWTMVGDRIVKGQDAIRQWMHTMPQDPPQFAARNMIAEGDLVTAHGDMTMKEKDGAAIAYSYCDIYRFRGDKVAELTSFVIKTDAKTPE